MNKKVIEKKTELLNKNSLILDFLNEYRIEADLKEDEKFVIRLQVVKSKSRSLKRGVIEKALSDSEWDEIFRIEWTTLERLALENFKLFQSQGILWLYAHDILFRVDHSLLRPLENGDETGWLERKNWWRLRDSIERKLKAADSKFRVRKQSSRGWGIFATYIR